MIPSGVTILDAMAHPELWARWFRDPATWRAWRVFLSVLFSLSITDAADLELFRECTGRTMLPPSGVREAWLAVGRKGGKSLILSLIACYLAVFRDWRAYLVPGEAGTIKIIATDRRQAGVIFGYCRSMLSVPSLAGLIDGSDGEEIRLSNGLRIDVQTASFRAVRGYTVIAALLDEIAFWRTEESANPDREILNALRPASATVPGAMLLAGSSPYARRGELWGQYRRHWGKDNSPVLIWQAPTWVMNPTILASFIDDEMERDPEAASAEYGARFRADLEDFVRREAVERCVMLGRYELPPLKGVHYQAFTDPSGGSQDAWTLGIGHKHHDKFVLDAIRVQKPPFSPGVVVADFAALLKCYEVREITGDRYGGEFPRDLFREHNIRYVPSEKTKSELYLEFLPLINGGRAELLDHPQAISELCGLERRTARSGKDSVDHGPGQHDDVINSVAGCLVGLVEDRLGSWRRLAAQDAERKEPETLPGYPREPAPAGMRWVLPRQIPFLHKTTWINQPGWQVLDANIVREIWQHQGNVAGIWLADVHPKEI